MRLLAVALSLLIVSAAYPADLTAADSTDAGAKVQALAQSYAAWGAEQSTPGASLTYKEVSHDGQKRTYRVLITGLPKGGAYVLLQFPITMEKPSVLMDAVFIDPTGILLCKKNGDVNSSADTVNLITDSVRGEPVRSALVSREDKSLRVLGKITPQPLESTGSGCKLTATYLTSHGEVVFMEATGLTAGEAFTIAMHSGSKEGKQGGSAPASGVYRASFLPVDPQVASKNGRAQFRLQAPSCTASLEVPWGNLAAQ